MDENIRIDESGRKWIDKTINDSQVLSIRLPNRLELRSLINFVNESAQKTITTLVTLLKTTKETNEIAQGVTLLGRLAHLSTPDELLVFYAENSTITENGKTTPFQKNDLLTNPQNECYVQVLGEVIFLDLSLRLLGM